MVAAVHERVMSPMEQASLRPHRRRLLSRAYGTVIDVGGGVGEHFSAYPPTVTTVRVIAIDPMVKSMVERRAKASVIPIALSDQGLADLESESADTVVTNLCLCAIEDVRATLAHVHRILCPDGLFLFCEHVPASGGRKFVNDLMQPWWETMSPGCRLHRDMPAVVRAAGLSVVDLQRFKLLTAMIPIQTCAAGVAHRARTRGSEAMRDPQTETDLSEPTP